MAGYRCSVCGLVSVVVNGCGCLPRLADRPAFAEGLSPAEVGRLSLLWVMSSPDRVYALDLAELELADHYGVGVVAGLGGQAADPVVLRHVTDARGIIARAIVVLRSQAAERARELARQLSDGPATPDGPGGASGGRGGTKVVRPIGPNTRPPGGVGAVPEVAKPAAVGWQF